MERKITAIVRQKRNPERVSIFLDEEYAFGLTRIVAAWLQVGQYLSEEKIDSLQAEDAQEVAYLIAIKYLDYRERSETEIRAHLNKRDINERVIEDVIDRLLRSGLVDDRRFAANWVENRLEFRPRGRRVAVRRHHCRPAVPALGPLSQQAARFRRQAFLRGSLRLSRGMARLN